MSLSSNTSKATGGSTSKKKKKEQKEEFHEELIKSYDFFNHPKFWASFLILFCFPLMVLLPMWATNDSSFVSPKKLPVCVETDGGVKDTWYCVPEKTAYSLIYNFGVWPPFLWFLTFGNFLGFYSIKNAYISFVKQRRIDWEEKETPSNGSDFSFQTEKEKEREEYLNAKQRIAEIKELEAREKRRYFVFDITFPFIRDIFGMFPCCKKCQKNTSFLDHEELRPSKIPYIICSKYWVKQSILFFFAMFVPLGVLLPIWTQDQLVFSLDVDGKSGKTVWIICMSVIPGLYMLFLSFVAGKRLRQLYLERYSKVAAAEKARKMREARLKLEKGGKKKKKKKGEEDDDMDDARIVVKKDDGIDPNKGTVIGRFIRRKCTPKVKIWSFITSVFFIMPLLVGLVAFYRAPDDFFISSMSTSDARLLLFIFVLGPPYFWFIIVCLNLTLEKRPLPPVFRTKEAYDKAVMYQRHLDEQFSRNLRWPRWMVYEYPYWSLGNGLITTGERRELAVKKGYQVNTTRFLIAWFLLFFIPIVVLLPIYIEEKAWIRSNDIDSGVGEWSLFAFIVGYPSLFVIFYTVRSILAVLPSEVKAMGRPVGIYFFIFVVIPLGVVEPLTADKFIYLSSDSALILRAIVLGLPCSLAGSTFAVFFFRGTHWWVWIHSLRIEMSIKIAVANFLKKVQPYIVIIPIILLIWSSITVMTWEGKDQRLLTIFVVTDTVLQFVFGILFAGGEIALLWGNHVKTTGGIERVSSFMIIGLSIYIGVLGAQIMNKWISQRQPYIQDRVDEDDTALYVFSQTIVSINICLIFLVKYKTYDNWIQMDYKRRFGHHPQDWEIDVPSLLTKNLPALTIQRNVEREKAIRSREKLLQIDEKYLAVKLVDGIEEEIIGSIKRRVKEQFIRKRMNGLKRKGLLKSEEDDTKKKKTVNRNERYKQRKGAEANNKKSSTGESKKNPSKRNKKIGKATV